MENALGDYTPEYIAFKKRQIEDWNNCASYGFWAKDNATVEPLVKKLSAAMQVITAEIRSGS